jgi:Cu(I)/Ag(I) efflux system periplasmic protein CusF
MKTLLICLSLLLLAAPLARAADADVVKIDKTQRRLTLKHNGVKNLDMPAMTMTFRVKDERLLDAVAVGDKVSFSADKLDGQYTVTALKKR